MTTLSLDQMVEECRGHFDVLNGTIEEISSVIDEGDSNKVKNLDDLRELSGKIKVFINGKLKQLKDLIKRLKLIEDGHEPQSEPPLFINDVQGYYDLTMIEARNIEQRIKELVPNCASSADNISKHSNEV